MDRKSEDDAALIIEFRHQLEQKSGELEKTATQLRLANERLEMLDQQQDNFINQVGQVSHELRTPMTSIRAFTEILTDIEDLEEDRARRYLKIIKNEAGRLTRLLDQILDANLLQRGELTVKIEAIEADLILKRGIEACQGLALQSSVEIKWQEHDTGAIVQADADRLCQVLINVLANAIKFNTSRDAWVIVENKIVEGNYHVTFQDNGPGIPAGDGERIFEKFARGRDRSTSDRSGLGLGLSISREIVRKFDGDLRLVPAKTRGACFLLTIPGQKFAT